MKVLSYIIIIMLATATAAMPQSAYLFNNNKGLANSLINDIEIDNNGFIWIATIDGLHTYDGRQFHKINTPHHNINKLYRLKNNDILIATNQGILKYENLTTSFKEIEFETSKEDFAPYITDIAGNDSTIYVTTSGFGIYSLAKGDSLFRPSQLGNLIPDQYIKSIFIDSRNRIWIGTYSEKSYVIHRNEVMDCPQLPAEISKFAEDDFGNIYAASTNFGISIIDPMCKNVSRIALSGVGADYPASAILISNNRILIGTDGLGMWEYQINNESSRQISTSEVPFDFNKSKIHDIVVDQFGNLWLGVFHKGLVLITKESSIFENYGYKPNSPYNIGSNSVGAMAAVGDQIWIGTESDGIYIWQEGCATQHIDIFDSHGKNVPCNIVSMYNQDNQYLWIGTYSNDFIKLDIRQKRVIKVYNLPCDKVSSISHGGKDKLLISSFGKGIGTFNTVTEKFEQGIMVNPSWSNCIKVDYQQNYWISTYSGLWYVDSNLKGNRHYSSSDGYLPDNSINYIYINRQNHVWCATNDGIMILNPMTEEHRHILNGHAICCIVEDAMGMVWISSRDGLFRYNPDNGAIIEFGIEDGLAGIEYSRGAGLITSNGMACFGGIMGITLVKTNNLTDSVTPGKVVPRTISVNNRRIATGDSSLGIKILAKNIAETDTIHLHESCNTFSLGFSTTNPANIDQTMFKYKILEIDSSYIKCEKGVMHATYTNMPHGTYTLEIIANIGHIESPVKRITIIVHPYWYHTMAAKIISAILILLILFLIYEYINERISRKHSDHINEMKMQFFINISHEIRTPLTLIIDPLEKLLQKEDTDEETSRLYSIMKTNSQRILRLVSQLLDLRKIDKGQVMMKFGKTDLCAFIRDIIDSCGPMMESKEISIDIASNYPNIYAWIDPENFEKIILNLLHNAVKFTPVGGEIEVEIMQDNEEKKIQVTVQDNGVGINNEEINKIFQRFYQARNQHYRYTTGTGVGLHLARYLTELHKGKLYASNRTDQKGSRFTIELPMGKNHLPEKDIIEELAPEPTSSREIAQLYKKKQAEASHSNIKTIYVVDDEESIRSYLISELQENYNVLGFENGKLAADSLGIQKPDLIICDIMMPEMDGWTFCKKVKRNYKTSHIPIILLTALGDDRNKSQGIEIGADMYLEKPFNTEILKKIIKNMLLNRDKVIANISNKAENYNIENIEIKSQDEILMQKVMQIIKDKISCRDLNVEMLADTIGISRVHLHRKIKEITGLSARDYLKNTRMKQASYLLTDKNLTISEIAYAVGYSNPGHFSSSFKAFYGVSPSEYAERAKDENGLANNSAANTDDTE